MQMLLLKCLTWLLIKVYWRGLGREGFSQKVLSLQYEDGTLLFYRIEELFESFEIVV